MNGDRELRDAVIRIDEHLGNIDERIGTFVTRPEFDPVKRIVYGAVALVLVGFMTTLIALVVVP